MRTTRTTPLILASVLPAVFGACFAVLPSRGGGQTEFTDARRVDAADVALPPGYSIEVVATGLHFPTGVAFDAEGRPHVTESGYSYGPVWLTPRLFRVEPNGALTLVVAGDDPPWNGLTYHDGAFFVAAAGHRDGGRILRVTPDGVSRTVADRLPSLGDHHTNGPVIGPDGWLYFGQGTATNSGIVGLDSYHQFGWLQRNPEVHDIPCRDVTLAGVDYTTENPFTPDDADRAGTGAFVPFADSTARGQIVRGSLPCNGAVLRVRPEGGPLELVAWGFRNPFGLAWSPDGRLFATDNGPDERGSRPIFGAGDVLWEVTTGAWYGWPDFHAGRPLTDADHFRSRTGDTPGFLLERHPSTPPAPTAMLGVHSSSNGFDFSRDSAFGYVGDAFVAQFGDMAPGVGKVLGPVGFKVVRVDVATGVVHDFAVNRGEVNGPASRLGRAGLERPVAARFDPSGRALYIVDFGVLTVDDGGNSPRIGTGVLWRVTRTAPP